MEEEPLMCPKCHTPIREDGLLAVCDHCPRAYVLRELKRKRSA